MGAAHARNVSVTPENFDALFDQFAATVYRLEALPTYAVAGAEAARIQAFQEGRPRPERSVRTSPWMARIATSTAAGKSWSRTRVVDNPLTGYQRYQLESYRESQAVGEQIRIAPRSAMSYSGPDFWLFDADTDKPYAVLMHYTPEARIDRRELTRDLETIEALRWAQAAIDEHGVPLNEFLAVGRG